MKKITLAIIDDYALVREALALSFREMGFKVALTCSYDKTTAKVLAAHTLHACCMNITKMDTRDTTRHIKAILPGVKVIGYALNNNVMYNALPAIDLFLFKSYSKRRVKRSVERLCLDAIDSG